MSPSTPRYRLGFDIGGTFTDFVLLEETTGALRVGKCLTTPTDPSVGALAGLREVLREAGLEIAALDQAIHGTTVISNSIIERKGAVTGLLTTRGFRDAVEIGTAARYDMYDLFLEYPAPLVPRPLRREVSERITWAGEILVPLDPEEVRREVRALVRHGVEAIAVCFVHAYLNPAHEEAAQAILRVEFPDLHVTLASRLAPEVGEYERTVTATANAYVQPLANRYLTQLEQAFRPGTLYLMHSNGGITSVETARQAPISIVESGPAAGAQAAAYLSGLIGMDHVISFDMGGTTAKACLIDQGEPGMARQFEAARAARFKPGSGLPLKVSVVDLIEIGAGGGSLARVDALGLVKVGPESAGADPGPACYELGGTEPTVTDANLLLGYLDPHYFLGGRMTLDEAAARRAIVERVAGPLGLDPVEAARGIHDIVNENMAGAARTHVAEKNRDPRRYALIAFGGAGPAHACEVARRIRAPRVVVPLAAGATSALGLLVAPVAFDFAQSYPSALDEVDWDRVNTLFAQLEVRGLETLQRAGVSADRVRFLRSAEMRYVGQAHEIVVPLPAGRYDARSREAIVRAFEAEYARMYRLLNPEYRVEAIHWRLRAIAPAPRPNLKAYAAGGPPAGDPLKGTRRAYFREAGGDVACPVYDHYRLRPGMRLSGPAIVEQRESTAVLGPKDAAEVDEWLNLIVAVGGSRGSDEL